jgi:hypothetical protein
MRGRRGGEERYDTPRATVTVVLICECFGMYPPPHMTCMYDTPCATVTVVFISVCFRVCVRVCMSRGGGGGVGGMKKDSIRRALWYIHVYVYMHACMYVHTCYVLIKPPIPIHYVLTAVFASCFYVLIYLLQE